MPESDRPTEPTGTPQVGSLAPVPRKELVEKIADLAQSDPKTFKGLFQIFLQQPPPANPGIEGIRLTPAVVSQSLSNDEARSRRAHVLHILLVSAGVFVVLITLAFVLVLVHLMRDH